MLISWYTEVYLSTLRNRVSYTLEKSLIERVMQKFQG